MENYYMLGFEEIKKRTESPLIESGIPVKDMEAKIEEYNFMDDIGAMTMALEIEGKAYNLYWRFSKGAADTNARVVFKEMMELEAKHIRYLKNLQSKLTIK
jgi:rubrerythrin